MTIKSVIAIPTGFEFSVACRGCRHEFTFGVPVAPPGPFNSRCPQSGAVAAVEQPDRRERLAHQRASVATAVFTRSTCSLPYAVQVPLP